MENLVHIRKLGDFDISGETLEAFVGQDPRFKVNIIFRIIEGRKVKINDNTFASSWLPFKVYGK